MAMLALAMFLGVFAFGHTLFGWTEYANNQIQIALFLTFTLGIIAGYKVRA